MCGQVLIHTIMFVFILLFIIIIFTGIANILGYNLTNKETMDQNVKITRKHALKPAVRRMTYPFPRVYK